MKQMDYYMSEMSKTQIRRFLNKGTFTGKLATVKKDGSLSCCSNLVCVRLSK